MSDPDGKIQEPMKEKDEPYKKPEKSEKLSLSEASRRQSEPTQSPSPDKGPNASSVKEPVVKWRHTMAAEKTMKDMEKAAELERRLKAKKVADADKQADKAPESPQKEDSVLGTASGPPSKESLPIGQPSKGKLPIDPPSKEIQPIPAADESAHFLDALSEPKEKDNKPKMSPDTKGKRTESPLPKPIEKLLSKPKKQKPTSEQMPAVSDKLESSKEEKPTKVLRISHTDHRKLKRSSRKRSSTVAVTSIEKEILNRTDPDLEEAINRSIFFSFKIREPLERPEDLAAYIQRIREEEADELASEAEQGPVLTGSDISIALSTDSAGVTDEGAVKKKEQLSWRERFLERVDDALSATVKSRHCMEIFRCASAIRKERRRQRLVNRFIIHPYSEFRIGWDIMVVIALILTMVALPIEIAFFSVAEETHHEGEKEEKEHDSHTNQSVPLVEGFVHEGHIYEGINLFAEAIFIIDIVLNFRTGYVFREMDQVILSNKAIVWHYLRTWFFFDFISAVPFDKIYEWSAGVNKDESQYLQIRLIRMAKILALLRAFQVFRLLRYIHTLETIFLLQENIVEICNLIGVTLLFAHWNACLQYMACFTEHYPNFPPDSWIAVDQLQWTNVTVLRRYTRSAVRALSHILAVGYAQVPPTATSETWIVLVSMLVGCTFYALFIAYMSALIRSLDLSGAQYNEEVDSLQEFLRSHKIPERVQRRVLRFLDQKFRHKFFDSDVYFKTSVLSPSFQESLSMHNCRRIVENVSFFRNASKEFIYAIVKRLEFQVFFPGELILRAGTTTQCLLLIAHGKVEVYSKAVLLEKIYDGGYYGEVSLLLHTTQQFDVIAADVSDIYLLTKEGFEEVLAEFSDIRDSLKEIGAVHLQRQTTRIELLKQDDLNLDPA